MPIDASIYSLIQPQRPSAGPMDQFAQAMQIRHLVGQNELAGLQRGELERGIAEEGKIRDLFARGNVKPEDVMAISPKRGLEYKKGLLEVEKGDADLRGKRMETMVKAFGILKDRLPTVRDEASYRAYVDTAVSLLGPDEAQKFNFPPAFDPEWVKRQAVEAKELFTQKPQQQGDRVIDMNPFTNPAIWQARIGMTASEQDSSQRGWAQLNRPQFSEERGWVTPPPVGPRTAPFASAPSGPAAAPSPAPRAPAAPVAAPATTPAPFVPKSELDRLAKLEAEKPKALQRVENAQAKAAVVNSAVDEALKQAKNFRWLGMNTPGSGLRRAAGSFVPGTDAYDLDKTIDTLKANLGFQELQAMREASPTGGALGQVAVEELRMLQSTVASLSVGQGQAQLEKNLAKIKTHFSNWKEAVRKHYEQQYRAPQQSQAPAATPPAGKRPSLKDILGS